MDKQEESQSVAKTFVIMVVGAIVAIVVIFAVINALSRSEPAVVTGGADEVIPEPVGEAMVTVYFEVGQSTLSGVANTKLASVIAAAKADPGKIVLISGFHDASGDPAQNAELARQRAVGVSDALAASGIAAERIKLRKPETTLGDGDPAEARRVELRVQ